MYYMYYMYMYKCKGVFICICICIYVYVYVLSYVCTRIYIFLIRSERADRYPSDINYPDSTRNPDPTVESLNLTNAQGCTETPRH